jgi:3-oxoacyl-[acyl-carrier protein] reductase
LNVVVVGGSSSVGEVLVEDLRREGHNVLPFSSREIDVTNQFYWRCPFKIDALVVLVGVCPGKELGAYSFGRIAQISMINFVGPLNVVRTFASQLDGASVALMSSVSGVRGSFDPIYAASKAALIGFVRSMSLHPASFRVNAIAPDLIEGSTMYNDMAEERRAYHRRSSPTGRLTSLQDVSRAIRTTIESTVNGKIVYLAGGEVRVED